MIPEIKNDLKQLEFIFDEIGPGDYWIAGGCFTSIFTNTKIHDVDIWFKNTSTKDFVIKKMNDFDNAGLVVVLRDNDYIMDVQWNGILVQFIKNVFFESPQDTIDQFDFTINKFALYHDAIYLHPMFFKHLAARKLVIEPEGVRNVYNTYKRVFKYLERGYVIDNSNMLIMAKLLNGIDSFELDSQAEESSQRGSAEINVQAKIDLSDILG